MTMTNPSSGTGDSPEENEHDRDNAETGIAGLLNGSVSFPGAQYFNEIMHEEMRPRKITKFKVPGKPDRDY